MEKKRATVGVGQRGVCTHAFLVMDVGLHQQQWLQFPCGSCCAVGAGGIWELPILVLLVLILHTKHCFPRRLRQPALPCWAQEVPQMFVEPEEQRASVQVGLQEDLAEAFSVVSSHSGELRCAMEPS